MSRKSTHMSRLYAPKSWRINRKETKWVTNTIPGTHKKDLSIPLVVAIRDNLKLVSTKRELNYLINNKLILLNNKAVNNSKIAAGLFDVVAFPTVKKYYRVVLDKNGKFMLIEISDKESNLILLKVTRKVAAKGKKIILTLSNGYNINFDKKVSVNDTVVFDTSLGKIKNVLSYKKGEMVYFIRGKRAGNTAEYQEKTELGLFKKTYIAKLKLNKEVIDSDIKNIMSIGNGKEIKVE